jgi:hypothetical protein
MREVKRKEAVSMNTPAAEHRLLKALLPAKAFDALRRGTREWLTECRCGHVRDYWDAGGIRYKATGEPRRAVYCPVCGKNTLQKIRKKTASENGSIGS